MFSEPNTIMSQLAIPLGATVADLGAGTGAFSFIAATKVGTNGKVYACEVQSDMITRINNEIQDRGIRNIVTVHSNIETHQGTKLRDQTIDWVLAVNVLFQVEDRSGFVKEIARITKPGGRVFLLDWSESFGNLGPHAKDIINEPEAVKLFEEQGFKKTPQVIQVGAHHYGIVFSR